MMKHVSDVHNPLVEEFLFLLAFVVAFWMVVPSVFRTVYFLGYSWLVFIKVRTATMTISNHISS